MQENKKQNEAVFWKRADGRLVLAVLAIAVFWILCAKLFGKEGSEAVVYVDSAEYARCPLAMDNEIVIGETNTIVIERGQVFMKAAECPDQICVRHKPISKDGESIVCLPNRVVVEIKGGAAAKTEEADIVAN